MQSQKLLLFIRNSIHARVAIGLEKAHLIWIYSKSRLSNMYICLYPIYTQLYTIESYELTLETYFLKLASTIGGEYSLE